MLTNLTHSEGKEDNQSVIPLSIISNSSLIREGLVGLLSDLLPIEFIGFYSNTCLASLDKPHNPQNHVAIVDGMMTADNRMECIQFWSAEELQTRVIVFELENDLETIVACIEAGASGYTLKGAPVTELAQAIQLTHRGLAQCQPRVTAELFARLQKRVQQGATETAHEVPLTPRELEVLEHIARHRSNREIASELVITVHTVKHHVHSILTKLDMEHRHAAAHHARQQGWIDSPNRVH